VELEDPRVGTVLRTYGGSEATVLGLTWKPGDVHPDRVVVYDIEVLAGPGRGLHNFFVRGLGQTAAGSDAPGVLVHNSSSVSALRYAPTRKHKKGGWGTEMDLDDVTALSVLERSVPGGRQRYGYHNGRVYEFQSDNVGGWHGYPIPGNEAPASVLKLLRDRGDFSSAVYKKLLKGT